MYHQFINSADLFGKEDYMTKKAKIILAVSLSTVAVAASAAAATVVICKKIYEKNYFSVN